MDNFPPVLLVLCSLLLISSTILSLPNDEFFFNGFNQAASSLTLDEYAVITPTGVLQLTNTTSNVVGHAFFSLPFNFFATHSNHTQLNSFITHFVFSIVSPAAGGGNGMTFVLSPQKSLSRQSFGPYLGLMEVTDNGNASNHILAVEFDTFKTGYGDINDNHVGIDINGVNSTVSEPAAYYTDAMINETIQLDGGGEIQAWVEYESHSRELKVTIAPFRTPKPTKPLITLDLDISTKIKESMYVGFTAATGKGAVSIHSVLGWSFKLGIGPAPKLDLKHLPSSPSNITLQQEDKTSGSRASHEIITAVVVSSIIPFALLCLIIIGCMFILRRLRLRDVMEEWEVEYPHRFKYKDLYVATKGFKESEILGRGGFGCVYKGAMPSTKEEVAIKRISPNSNQGIREFVAEISSLGRLRHRHLVHLLGWCKWKGDLLIAYEYMTNGSLADLLFTNATLIVLSWKERFRILKGVASALLYLHEEWEQVVVHRDVKASNVLLDASMNARLGDFGLARLYDHGSNPLTTHIVGTLGYMAPEISRKGKATPSSDVYAYGILLLEVACGRVPIEPKGPSEQLCLLEWVQKCFSSGKALDAMDPKLGNDYEVEEGELVLKLGLICSHSEAEARPTMRQVCQYLDGLDLLPEVGTQSFGSTDHKYSNGDSSSYPNSFYGDVTRSLGSGR